MDKIVLGCLVVLIVLLTVVAVLMTVYLVRDFKEGKL